MYWPEKNSGAGNTGSISSRRRRDFLIEAMGTSYQGNVIMSSQLQCYSCLGAETIFRFSAGGDSLRLT